VLGLIKVWEIYQDRNRLEITRWWVGLGEEGWTIFLYNLGEKPVSIYYFEFFWSKHRFWSERQFMEHFSPGAEGFDLTIEPGKKKSIQFAEEKNFSRKNSNIPNAHLYIRLTLVGRRRKKVYLVD
jgi:hypothetical protein